MIEALHNAIVTASISVETLIEVETAVRALSMEPSDWPANVADRLAAAHAEGAVFGGLTNPILLHQAADLLAGAGAGLSP